MDNLAVQVDDTSDVKTIKVIPVKMVKPLVPHTYIYKLKIHQPKPAIIKYVYVSTDFILDFDD
jgi:hypothetical protein